MTILKNITPFIFQNPKLLTSDWIEFFDGLKEDTNNILKNIKGPSWSPKKIKQLDNLKFTKEKQKEEISDFNAVKQASTDSVRAIMLIRAYRIRGHLIANLDPLNLNKKEEHPELKPETYGFKPGDYNRKIFLDGVLGLQYGTLNEILKLLKRLIALQWLRIHAYERSRRKAWVRDRIEGPEKNINFTDNGKKAILNKIIEAEGFEKYLQVKFVGTKRFGLDGGESLIPALEQIIKRGGNLGVKEIKIGMPHRGRLNVLANNGKILSSNF